MPCYLFQKTIDEMFCYNEKNKLVNMRLTFILSAIAGSGVLLLSIFFLLMRLPNNSYREKIEGNNIVLIVMDAFRADRIGKSRNGVPLTPFLDSIATDSAVFTNAVTNCTWTRPSMASLFTSMYVDAHQVVYDNHAHGEKNALDALSPELPTIATYLKNAGYMTIGIQTNGNLFPELGFSRGFDVYRTSLDAKGTLVTDWAIEELKSASSPFFLYVHYMDTHAPYNPPETYLKQMGYTPDALPEGERAIVDNFLDYLVSHCRHVTGQIEAPAYSPLSEAGREAVKLVYDAVVRYTDDEVARLVNEVRRCAPDTVFIITADHGEHFWDHGLLGHGITLYNCELRVPLYFSGKGIQPGVIGRMTEMVDVLPGIAGILGLAPEGFWQGNNLFSHSDKAVYSRTKSIAPVYNTDLEMVISSGKKLIADNHSSARYLFDWTEDPDEKRNLAEEEPDTVKRLEHLLQRHRQRNLRARKGEREQATLDEETLEQLKNLGYVK